MTSEPALSAADSLRIFFLEDDPQREQAKETDVGFHGILESEWPRMLLRCVQGSRPW